MSKAQPPWKFPNRIEGQEGKVSLGGEAEQLEFNKPKRIRPAKRNLRQNSILKTETGCCNFFELSNFFEEFFFFFRTLSTDTKCKTSILKSNYIQLEWLFCTASPLQTSQPSKEKLNLPKKVCSSKAFPSLARILTSCPITGRMSFNTDQSLWGWSPFWQWNFSHQPLGW